MCPATDPDGEPKRKPAADATTAHSPPRKDASQLITFLRRRDYHLVRELGEGACGKTVLLHDEYLDQHYVCKKYAPNDESRRQEFFEHFVKEVKLLHLLHHRNVVRVFNHYLYPESCTGYILMEYVNGQTLDRYLASRVAEAENIFTQAIAGFSHLEREGILHRDIRAHNLMVTTDGTLKIIDLGFGKRIRAAGDFAKSISLNWAYAPPNEFAGNVYDFGTEVYFVGMLFREWIDSQRAVPFKYRSVLERMCQSNPSKRSRSFVDIEQEIAHGKFDQTILSNEDLDRYRRFADIITMHVTKIESKAKYVDDADKVLEQLSSAFSQVSLERDVPDCGRVLRSLIQGGHYYLRAGMPVKAVREFLEMFRRCSPETQRIILANLHARFDALPRYFAPPKFDSTDDIPF